MLLLAITGAALGVGLLLESFKQPKKMDSKVTLENYYRLRAGMKEIQVHQILGFASRRDDSMVPRVSNLSHRYKVEDNNFPQRCFWEEGEDFIWVTIVESKVTQYGATLDGVRYGDDIKAPLILETQEKE
jgi:hypothetical protein